MNSTRRQRCGWLVAALVLLAAGPVLAGSRSPRSVTVTPIILELSGPVTDPQAEISGMTWKGDTLVILPENPTLFADSGQLGFFVINRGQILAAIDGTADGLITPRQVSCDAPGMSRVVSGFDGLEALGLIGDRCYMTMEAKGDTAMSSYLVCGDYDVVSKTVVMDLLHVVAIPLGLNIYNLTEEALVVDGNRVITLGEANGRNVNPHPVGKIFDTDLKFLGTLPLPHIEYRVTDATKIDDQRRFWVINYFYPPDGAKLKPVDDPKGCVERLLELQIVRDDEGREMIVRTETPPLNLALLPDGECRNWEALARLEDRGFLLMTDKYPGTLLAFVPYEQKD